MVVKMKARRALRDSMRTRNVPSVTEIEKVRNLQPGRDVLAYRETEGWTPCTFVRVRSNNVVIILSSGRIASFYINIGRIYYSAPIEAREKSEEGIEIPTDRDGSARPVRDNYQIITRARAKKFIYRYLGSVPRELFKSSRMEEIAALQQMGCFEVVPKQDSDGYRLYRPTFVGKVKLNGEKRSRLCVAACNDQNHGLFTAAPTIKRLSLRLLLCVAASPGFDLTTRHVTRAFVMSKTPLHRPFYLSPPVETGLPKGKVLKVIRPLRGMHKSPIHLLKTCTD